MRTEGLSPARRRSRSPGGTVMFHGTVTGTNTGGCGEPGRPRRLLWVQDIPFLPFPFIHSLISSLPPSVPPGAWTHRFLGVEAPQGDYCWRTSKSALGQGSGVGGSRKDVFRVGRRQWRHRAQDGAQHSEQQFPEKDQWQNRVPEGRGGHQEAPYGIALMAPSW